MFIYPLTLHSPCTILTLVDSIITAVCIPQVQRSQKAKIKKVKFKLVGVALYIHAPCTMHCAHWLDQPLPRSLHILDNNFDIEDCSHRLRAVAGQGDVVPFVGRDRGPFVTLFV